MYRLIGYSVGINAIVCKQMPERALDACSRECSTALAQDNHSTLARNVALHETLKRTVSMIAAQIFSTLNSPCI